jgi:tRNA threonylcarbamoyladenosine biosynthesis protein TsaE
MMTRVHFETHSPTETECLGRALAELLPCGSVVALFGDLATGKTCLVRGMASFFALGQTIHSPTFTLVNEYGLQSKLYHLDLYRLAGPEELGDLGYEEIFDSNGVCAVEWAERAGSLLPEQCLRIYLAHGGGDCRSLTIEAADGCLPEGWVERLQASLPTCRR